MSANNNTAVAIVVTLALTSTPATATPCGVQNLPICTFVGSDTGFYLTYAGMFSFTHIDFETLPDGSPSYGGAQITPAFNYTAQGATFSSPSPPPHFPFIAGNSDTGFGLRAYTGSTSTRQWITADLSHLEPGVGIYTVGNTTLYAYDAQGALIASVSYSSPGGIFFLGLRSDTPVARAIVDRGGWIESIDEFVIVHQVPEPASVILALAGWLFVCRRGKYVMR